MPRGNVTVRITGDTSGLSSATNRAQSDLNRLGGTASKQSKAMSQLSGAVKASAAAIGITGLGAAVVGTSKLVVDFDKAMRNVNSIAQLNEKQFQGLSKQVLALAGPTAQAPQTLAEGMYTLVSSGFKARDALKVLRSSARAATAGLTTTEVSTKAVAAVLNAYKRPADDARAVSDALFRTVDRGVISFEDLAENIGDTLPFASTLGVDIQEVGAAIATMTKQGLGASLTMTRIRNLLQTMIKPGDDLQDAFKKIGVESGEALIKQRGFQGALQAVIGTTDGSKAAIAKLFPNIRALGGAMALTGKNTQGAQKDLEGMRHSSGATSRALSQQAKSVSFEWQRLKAEMAAVGISIGQQLIPPMRRVVTAFKDGIAWLTKFHEANHRRVAAIGRFFTETFNGVKRTFGNVMAFILRKFADLFDVASHLPFVGKKFGELRDRANEAAAKIDRAGEKTRDLRAAVSHLPSRKRLQVQVDLLFKSGGLRGLPPAGTFKPTGDGPGIEEWVDKSTEDQVGKWVRANRQQLMAQFSPLGFQAFGAKGALQGVHGPVLGSIPVASRFGLGVTSGFRPGSITSSGNLSYHALGRAIDFADGAAQMVAFARYMGTHFGGRLKELIHTPLGWGIKNGQRVGLNYWGSAVNAGHYGHVHVAMAQGGKVDRRVTALVGEEGPEIVSLPDGAEVFSHRRSRRMLGSLAGLIPGFQAGGVVRAARAAGFRHRNLVEAVAIALAESGGNPRAVSSTGDYGLWQINKSAWGGRFNFGRIFNPLYNARAAYQISHGGSNWHPWVTYNTGAYRSHLDEARRAVLRTRGERHAATRDNRDPTRRGAQRLTPAERRERTPIHGRVGLTLEDRLTRAGTAIERADVTPGTRDDISARERKLVLLATKRRRLRRRLRKINHALRGKLRPATRRRLLQERSQILGDLGSVSAEAAGLGGDIAGLLPSDPRAFAALDRAFAHDFGFHLTQPPPAEVGGGGGVDTSSTDALTAAQERANQLMEEHNTLLKEQTANQKQLITLTQTQGPQILGAVIAAVSGDIGGRIGLGFQTPSFAGGLARY